jgi:hypothetical protein
VTTEYDQAIRATASRDGSEILDLQLPGTADRSRVDERRPATLPPGIARITEDGDLVLTDDVIAEPLVLPSGAVVADAALAGGVDPLPYTVDPGSYPVHVTLAAASGDRFGNVAFASLVVSDSPTVRWTEVPGVGVDGGTAGFVSAEGSDALGQLIADDDAAWSALQEAAFDSLAAHDYLVTDFPIDDTLNMVLFSTGYGDGGYPLFVGLDANGKPTRFVIDFLIIHLDWPTS